MLGDGWLMFQAPLLFIAVSGQRLRWQAASRSSVVLPSVRILL